MMFGYRNHRKELLKEFRTNLTEAKRNLGKEQADLIRAQYNVQHHLGQIDRYQNTIANYERSLAELERIMNSEREEVQTPAQATAGARVLSDEPAANLPLGWPGSLAGVRGA